MSEAKHTPGPWVIDEDDLRDDTDTVFSIGIWTDKEDPLMVAHVSAFSLRSEMVDEVEHVSAADPAPSHLSQAKANARLIAAAPELLAFAQEFLSDYQSEDGMASMKHYANQAYAAIAKATGEQK